ncbi:hypothetical protein [Pseudomonas sp. LP_7_YM]|uniref:hypothetical protein n=1 Tax=Pseudomonas sp. LP_7_YM TaxID=2485137 RepID=UPI00141523DD|nr:hypothetical protein [Pseudomonas sp. LP_7_YM]
MGAFTDVALGGDAASANLSIGHIPKASSPSCTFFKQFWNTQDILDTSKRATPV